ncbi:reverse transcriptase domain-containing protein [Variovorax sp.]|jgi:RNA-directed DNA polymerase|uniref:reverse transcriptase domain-containing protein n=1 Tax=Variovorax sp. TaxID=1871043 RepID=UPI0037DA21DD
MRLSSQLRTGQFRFGSLQPFLIPKDNGKNRLICVPNVADRVVQRAILDYLTPKNGGWLANGVSFGFVPDLGVPDAVKLAVKYRGVRPWVFKTDITAFFDRIDRKQLLDRVRSQLRQRSLHSLIESAIDCEILARTERMRKSLRAMDIREGRGVRQGMPLSPFFANLVLAPFDKACTARGLAAIRYADDLIFFATSKAEAVELQKFCLEQLDALNLQIPELGSGSKTQIYEPNEPAEFLGVELRLATAGGYEVAISPLHMQKIKQRIYSYGNLQELRTRGLDVTKFGNSLRSSTAAYGATYSYCCNAQDLLNHLNSWQKATMTSIVKALGLEPGNLTIDQRWFLGLE